MNIVILDSDPAFGSQLVEDGVTVGGIECPQLHKLGTVQSHRHTAQHEIIERSRHATILLTNKVNLGANEFAKLPHLKLVCVLATGVNIIDLSAARRHDVVVCNVPGYSTASTAQHTIALMLELFNQVGAHNQHTTTGHWQNAKAFSYFLAPTTELEGKTFGVVGLGAIGNRVAQIAQALGMSVIAHTRTARADSTIPLVSLPDLLASSDVVSLHCPLTPQTERLINASTLSLMRPGAVLINVSRGPIVDEAALADSLRSGRLAGAAVDVLVQEPPTLGSPLLGAPNCIVTPHIAWASVEARRRLLSVTVDNIAAFIQGTAQNVVNSG